MPQPPLLQVSTEQYINPKFGPDAFLTRSRRPVAHYELSPPATLRVAPVVTEISVTLVTARRSLFRARRVQRTLRAPLVILPLPTLAMQTVRVVLAVQSRVRIRPLVQGWYSTPRGLDKFIGAAPPYFVATATLAKPLSVLTSALRDRIDRSKRAPHWLLRPPPQFLALPPPVATTIDVSLARRAPRRPPLSRLAPPLTAAPATPPVDTSINVTLARYDRLRRRAQRTLGGPVVVAAAVAPLARPVAVAQIRIRPRAVFSRLYPPVTAPVAPQAFTARPVKTALARSRRPLVRALLSKPTVVAVQAQPVEQTVQVALARLDRLHRRVQRALGGPVVISPATPPSGPIPLAPISVTLNRSRIATQWQRQVLSQLPGPAIINPSIPTQAQSTITVALTRIRPRRSLTRLFAPTTLQAAAPALARPIDVTLASQPRVRRANSKLRSPSVVATAAPPLAPPIKVTLNRSRLATYWQRYVLHALFAPMIVNPPVPVVAEVTVTLAGRTRAETQRRKSTYHLAGPTRVIPLPTLRMQTISVSLVRRVTRPALSKLRAPATLQAAVVFVARPLQVALVKTRPRQTKPLLSEPVVVKAQFIASPVKVALARIRPRAVASELRAGTVSVPLASRSIVALTSRPRRVVRSVLRPPAVTAAAQRVPDSILVRLSTQARTARRGFRSLLRSPIATPPVESQIALALARIRRLRAVSLLRRPGVIAPTPLPQPDQRTILVRYRVAVDTRTGLIRRGTHSFIEPPTVIGASHQPVRFTTDVPHGNWVTRKPKGIWRALRPFGNWKTRRPSTP